MAPASQSEAKQVIDLDLDEDVRENASIELGLDEEPEEKIPNENVLSDTPRTNYTTPSEYA